MIFIATNRKPSRGSFGGQIRPRGELTYLSGPDLGDQSRTSFRRRLLRQLKPPEDLAEGSYAVPRVVGFFHGYNSGWDDSLRWVRMVDEQLTQKLQGQSATVGFSWPSEGKVVHYLDDRHMAEESAPAVTRAIGDAIQLLERERCSAELSLIAHSMGSYVLAQAALRAWELKGKPTQMPLFSEIILAAPDLDANALEPGKVGQALPVFARRLHVYSSRKDRALLASAVKRAGVTGPRLGRQGPARMDLLPTNVVHVDATAWTDLEGVAPHSAHFHEPVIVADMLAVLAGEDRNEINGRMVTGENSYAIPRRHAEDQPSSVG